MVEVGKKIAKRIRGKKKPQADVTAPATKKTKKVLSAETVEECVDEINEYPGGQSTYGESIYEDFDG